MFCVPSFDEMTNLTPYFNHVIPAYAGIQTVSHSASQVEELYETGSITETSTIGGRAWPNVRFNQTEFDLAFAVWGNCTLGLITYWWHSNRQVSGRGAMSIRSADSLPVLDFRALTNEQLLMAQAIINEFRDKDLKPAYLADADHNRALLDRRVICDLLGFDEETYVGVRRLASKWCAEPSVHGGKPRPNDAKLIS